MKGIALAAFASAATFGGLVYTSLSNSDLPLSASENHQQPDTFYDIPATDIVIAVYASYFSGTNKHGDFDLDSRAENTFGMNNALLESFTGENAPWIMLDSLSDGRNDSNVGANMHGAHFITMYHKDTQQVVITMPGMEYDYSLTDTLDDAQQLFSGSLEQTKALREYTELVTHKIQANEFFNKDGIPLDISSDRPIIASHSLGSKPTHIMSVAGYKTIMTEPRPLTGGYINDLNDLYKKVYGAAVSPADITDALDQNTISIRAGHANVWNSPLMPWENVHIVPNTYVYGTGEAPSLSDRHVAGDHAAEVFVPSIMRALNPLSSADEAPKGKIHMALQKLNH